MNATRRMPDEIPVTEPVHVPDVFSNGIAEIDGADGVARLTWYARRMSEGRPERQIVDRIVIPIAAIPQVMRVLANFYADKNKITGGEAQ